MSNQTSATETVENLAIVLAEQVKAGTMKIDEAKHIVTSLCLKTFKQYHYQFDVFEKAWVRFNGRIRKP